MGRPHIDLSGQKFSELTVVGRDTTKRGKGAYWICRCSCDNTTSTEGAKLRKGKTKSCGCKRGKLKIETMGTHGMTNTRLYRIWHSMKSRCKYKSTNNYERYGGRGIKVCAEWDKNFELFARWAHSNGYKDYLSLDRENFDGNYEPSNCRWVKKVEQDNNRSSNRHIEHNGKQCTIAEFARIRGLKYETVRSRIRAGKYKIIDK